jgi:hypothetical protein
MKTQLRLAALCLVALFGFSGAALAALPTESGDIKHGDDLAAACTALVEHDVSEDGKLASKACSDFLGAMVKKVFEATEPGMPTEFSRVGPKDETVCFRLPAKLSFVDFAKLVLNYRKSHPELDGRPAFELGAWTLSTNFPCSN